MPGRRPPAASRWSARRSSIIAARAGGQVLARFLGSGDRRPPPWRTGSTTARVAATQPPAARPSRGASDTWSGAAPRYAGQRLVEHPEQAALEVHRQPAVVPERVEVDRDARARAALACRPPERGHQPEVVEDHRSDVEDERLRRVQRLLDHRDQLAHLARGHGRVACRRGAPRSGPGARCWSGSGPGRRASPGRSPGGGPPGRPITTARHAGSAWAHPPAAVGLGAVCRSGSDTGQPVDVAGDGVAIAGEGPALALEDLDLGLHQRRSLGQRHQRRRLLEALVASRPSGRPASLSAAAVRRRLVTRGLGLGLGRRQVDLAELVVERDEVVGEPGRDRRRPPEVGRRRGRRSAINPRASGSSPGAWRTPRPGSGR